MKDPEYALPEDPILAAVAAAMDATGHWAWVVDAGWRIVFATEAVRYTAAGGTGELARLAIGHPFFGTENLDACRSWRFGPNSTERMAMVLEALGGWMLTDTALDADELRRSVDPSLHDVLERLEPTDGEALSFVAKGMGLGHAVDVPLAALRLRRGDGRVAGTLMIFKPAANMAVLGAFAAMADMRHLELVQQVSKAARRPAAILFADLEGSSQLARQLSTASYFAVGRRLVRAADECVVESGGLVGRHVGDGIVAFFPAETAGSESSAARRCITAARSLRTALAGVAARSDLEPEAVVLRFGLHWGSTLFMGAVTSGARSEVTALGDEVNEAARIEACATGGRALASKALLERLDPADAAALDLDPANVTYAALASLPTATDKARRDAPDVAVYAV